MPQNLRRPEAKGRAQFQAVTFEPTEMPAFPFETEPLPQPEPFLDCPAISKTEADSLISSEAEREDLSPALLRAVIKRESAFHPCAVSGKGALGLMQLMPATAEQFGVDDPFNPKQNLRGGAAFLKQLLNRFGGDVRLALGAYNAGPERVDAAGGVPAIAETEDYVAAISDDIGLSQTQATETSKPVTNAMAQPDLRHLTLAPAGLNFATQPTPVHLASSP